MAKRTYIIGDVHGCPMEWSDLVVKCFTHAEGNSVEFVYVGDLIDKGPASDTIVHCIDDLAKRQFADETYDAKVTLVLGNHEEKFLRYVRHLDKREKDPSYKVPMEPKKEWTAKLIAFARDPENILNKGVLWYRVPDTEILVVHAGIEPLMQELPDQDLRKASKQGHNILRTRYVNPEGRMIQIGKENFDEDVWWADVYDGRFGFVVYGHQPFNVPYRTEHALGIDTGCVHGRTLTAWCLETDEFLSVEARKLYATQWRGPGRE